MGQIERVLIFFKAEKRRLTMRDVLDRFPRSSDTIVRRSVLRLYRSGVLDREGQGIAYKPHVYWMA